MVNSETVLEEVLGFQARIAKFAEGRSGDWRVEKKILENDLDEFNERVFEKGAKDYDELHAQLHPMYVGRSGDPWKDAVSDLSGPHEALRVIEHRLRQDQSRLKSAPNPDEHLLEAGKPHSAYVLLREIVESTVGKIMLVDPYVDRTLFVLLSNLKSTADIRILTRSTDLPADFLTEANRFSSECGHTVQVRTAPDIHDRFLVIDGRLFSSGASFKDLGKKMSVIQEIEDVKPLLTNELETRWTAAQPL